MTTPVPDEAVDWAAAVLTEELADAYDMGIEHNAEALRRIAARALAAASPAIRRPERERWQSLKDWLDGQPRRTWPGVDDDMASAAADAYRAVLARMSELEAGE